MGIRDNSIALCVAVGHTNKERCFELELIIRCPV